MAKYLSIVILVLISAVSVGQQRKFQINGSARGYYFDNDLDIDDQLDSITTRKANYGHTLMDLAVSVFPEKNTEIIGTFRIRNELGGFWGAGTSFLVRQLTLRGVAGGVVRYELGDIDLKLTPYTLHNFEEEGMVNEADVFALRRDIVHYDMFYNAGNTWRMQGANVGFGLNFSRLIDQINVKAFITRQRMTDGLAVPERLYGGGTLQLVQSEQFNLSVNSVNIFDLKETIPDSIQFKNSVHSMHLAYAKHLAPEWKGGVEGEAGFSETRYINYSDTRAPEQMGDWFYDVGLNLQSQPNGIRIKLGYKDIGADFLSPGAQTKRINYEKYPGVFQQITNDAIGRPMSYSDVISGAAETSVRISEELLVYNPAYDNATPYGAATPNRRGTYLNVVREDTVGFREIFVEAAYLTQSRGTGTLQKKKFIVFKAGADVYFNDWMGWKNDLKMDLGVRFENTSRSGEAYETITLNSTMVDAGLTWEFVSNFDVMLGAKMLMADGNAFVDLRNRYNTIENFAIADVSFTENLYAAGLRYRFNERNAVSAHYQMFNIVHADAQLVDYGITQFSFLLSLKF
ncbi:MAG: hypothetical protein KDC12_00820 [Flavobacteriales bacterium]|nr:hypothetical protein [Flavobacteriales bacterium]